MSTAPRHDDNHADDEMLSIEEAAAFLRVSVATMRYWRYCGDGPFSFKVGRHVRYWRTNLILWRADQGRRPDPDSSQTAGEATLSDRRVTMVTQEGSSHGREHR